MNNNISTLPLRDCYGCRGCEQICPNHCITMGTDSMGFIIPLVNSSQCINCGLCLKVCPRIQYKEPVSIAKTYAIKHKNQEVRSKSSSGGAFTAISDIFLENKGLVAGVIFDIDKQKTKYILASSPEQRNQMRGSKYVQADTEDIYTQIKNKLKENIPILFVGTPCQCEGLRKFLMGKDYENLLIVDILCHSVPSPLIFSEAIKRFGNIKKVIMRDKSNGWRGSSGMKICTTSNQDIKDYTYMNLFYKGLINRPSCGRCQFTKINRCSDITIGDYWKIDKIVPLFEDRLGVSVVIVNTTKGEKLFKQIISNIEYIETTVKNCIQFCMQYPTRPSSQKDKFWKDFNKYGYAVVANKYGYYSSWEKFKSGPLASYTRKLGISRILRMLQRKIQK